MKKFLVPVAVESIDDGRFLAICDAIQGCHAEGDSIADALENLEEVARILLDLRSEDGLPMPEGLEEFHADVILQVKMVVALPE